MPVPSKPKTFSEKMKDVPAPGRSRGQPLWQGPEVDGITFSMLSRFVVCRERFRIHYVEGLQPNEQFNHRIEYGHMWHVCEEFHAQGQAWEGPLRTYAQNLCQQYRTAQDQVLKWYRICRLQFPRYLEYWSKHPDNDDRHPVLSEFTFNVPYNLPSGNSVRLRGKWDSVDIRGKGQERGMWLQENKTKGDIEPLQIQRQLTFDLQTMLYLTALSEVKDESDMPEEFDYPLRGVCYNVVRRPLSGGKGSIKQKQTETEDQYYDRLAEYIDNEPETYFMRWKVEVTPDHIERFRNECLNPLLQQVVDWYTWIRECGGDYFKDSYACGIHWRHPFGVYNVLDEGGSSDLDEYLSSGSEVGLERVDRLFTELEGS